MAEKKLNPQNEEALGAAKEVIGQVRGDADRAAEGRAQEEHAQRGQSMKDTVDAAIKDTSGTESSGR
ncbi:MAG TPA: hypothetical protein VGJ14_19235 [Sporichthyaceae bacterium]|jgi:uncharacterized protein YjbJ (UPF0337 family)